MLRQGDSSVVGLETRPAAAVAGPGEIRLPQRLRVRHLQGSDSVRCDAVASGEQPETHMADCIEVQALMGLRSESLHTRALKRARYTSALADWEARSNH